MMTIVAREVWNITQLFVTPIGYFELCSPVLTLCCETGRTEFRVKHSILAAHESEETNSFHHIDTYSRHLFGSAQMTSQCRSSCMEAWPRTACGTCHKNSNVSVYIYFTSHLYLSGKLYLYYENLQRLRCSPVIIYGIFIAITITEQVLH